ncbi:universal stress protein [Actinoplanes rectilineatus]|uniref:universal stress protein n=1 Tax=Actinoplanes rectilineatus TaxID=113571 RepID=UPI0005F2962D|nr:universal stress protein [Actinoplanes rectilineatus]
MTSPVIVGIDGSPRSLDAVVVAAGEAARRGGPLRIVRADVWSTVQIGGPGGVARPSTSVLAEQAEEELVLAERAARAAVPALRVTTELVAGSPAQVLLAAARDAARDPVRDDALIVLGDRGMGAIAGLLAGSVVIQVVTDATCPVLVVRGETRDTGPVVAGVDGSPHSAATVAFAAEQARLRGAELVTVHAGSGALDDPTAGPGRHETVPGPARRVLTERSREAQLIVVGSRGRGGFAGLMLGSVSQHLVHHAACPVAVVRTPRNPDEG